MESLENINIILKENNLRIILKFDKEKQRVLFIEPWWEVAFESSDFKTVPYINRKDIKGKKIIGISIYNQEESEMLRSFKHFEKLDKPINYEEVIEIIKQKIVNYKLKAI